jgi:hypothetical protein
LPPDYDAGALPDELIKLRLLVVETHDVATLLVPAESESHRKPVSKARQTPLKVTKNAEQSRAVGESVPFTRERS